MSPKVRAVTDKFVLETTYEQPKNMPPALFAEKTSGVIATDLTRGPWSHGVMHGGPICGLLSWVVEVALNRTDLICTRLTVEILSGVAVSSLEVSSQLVKNGRKTAVVDGQIHEHGKLVARASSQWLAPSEINSVIENRVPDIPAIRADPGSHPGMEYPRPGFNADAIDMRVIEGSTEEPGPGRIWIRLDCPLIDGQETSPFQRISTLSDLGAAVGWENSYSGGTYINTDVTLQMIRKPQGEWVFFESHVEKTYQGIACCYSNIYDEKGLLGWVMQSQIEAPEDITF